MTRLLSIVKKPNEKYAVGLKYQAPDLEEGQSISSVSVSITPTTGVTPLIVDGSPSIDGDTVSQVIKAGVNGENYYVIFTTTTSIGHIYEDRIFVKVRSN